MVITAEKTKNFSYIFSGDDKTMASCYNCWKPLKRKLKPELTFFIVHKRKGHFVRQIVDTKKPWRFVLMFRKHRGAKDFHKRSPFWSDQYVPNK